MFNFKICGIAAGIAFILSIILGLFGGVGFLALILRAIIFAAVFFALSCFIFWLLAQFVPELLSGGDDDLGFPAAGSRVDISLGDGGITGAFPTDSSDLVDDIGGRPSTPKKAASLPLDQEDGAGYNANGEAAGDLKDAGGGMAFGASYGGMSGRKGSGDTLPDMDSLAGSVPESAADMVNAGDIGFDSFEPRRPKSSSRKSEMAGDFDPKELAQAIQTVLRKDEKG